MAKREFLGGFELLVLLALIRLGDEAYGVPISDAIEESSGREVAMGSVYITLARLERNGLVSSKLGEATAELGEPDDAPMLSSGEAQQQAAREPHRVGAEGAERGGRAKTYFRITAKGLREVRQAQRTLMNLWQGVPQLQRGAV